MLEHPSVRWPFTGSWAKVKISFNTLALKLWYSIESVQGRQSATKERNGLQKGREKLIKPPGGLLSQTVNTSIHGVPQILCSADLSICITNNHWTSDTWQWIKPSHDSRVEPQLVHSMAADPVLLWNPESSSSIHHNHMSETGIWDTCEYGPKIGLIYWQHGGLGEGEQVEHDVSRSASLHESNNTKAQRDSHHREVWICVVCMAPEVEQRVRGTLKKHIKPPLQIRSNST